MRIIKMILLSMFVLLVATSCSSTTANSKAVWGPSVYVDDGTLERIEGSGSCTYVLGMIPIVTQRSGGGGLGSMFTSFLDPQ